MEREPRRIPPERDTASERTELRDSLVSNASVPEKTNQSRIPRRFFLSFSVMPLQARSDARVSARATTRSLSISIDHVCIVPTVPRSLVFSKYDIL